MSTETTTEIDELIAEHLYPVDDEWSARQRELLSCHHCGAVVTRARAAMHIGWHGIAGPDASPRRRRRIADRARQAARQAQPVR